MDSSVKEPLAATMFEIEQRKTMEEIARSFRELEKSWFYQDYSKIISACETITREAKRLSDSVKANAGS